MANRATAELKATCVRELRGGRNAIEICRSYQITPRSLFHWNVVYKCILSSANGDEERAYKLFLQYKQKRRTKEEMATEREKERLRKDLHKKALEREQSIRDGISQFYSNPVPNKFWIGDYTVFRIKGQVYFLYTIMDVFSSKIIAYRWATEIDAQHMAECIVCAYKERGKPIGVYFQISDDGQIDRNLNGIDAIQVSCSANMDKIESFFVMLKSNMYHNPMFECFSELRSSVESFMEFYNNEFRKISLGYISPAEYEKNFYKDKLYHTTPLEQK